MEGAPLLEARDVVVRYGAVTAVNEASLEVRDGEIVSLIGPNGAGKTTLFNVIAGVVRPERGSVRLEGKAVDRLPPHIRARRGLGRTFQGGRLFGRLTLLENLELAHYQAGRSQLISALVGGPSARLDRRRDRRVASRVLSALDLEDYSDAPCSALPCGVQRLAEVARALCIEPRVLLLDEPSAGLDPSESAHLGAVVKRIRDVLGISVLLIEHDMTFVMNISDYVYVLDFGLPLAEGTPDAVRSNDSVIAAYLGEQIVA
ncbi:MAG: ABC transporter ATP-binding protein [Actinomycetota bacterium]